MLQRNIIIATFLSGLLCIAETVSENNTSEYNLLGMQAILDLGKRVSNQMVSEWLPIGLDPPMQNDVEYFLLIEIWNGLHYELQGFPKNSPAFSNC